MGGEVNALVFGNSGTLGAAVVEAFERSGTVVAVPKRFPPDDPLGIEQFLHRSSKPAHPDSHSNKYGSIVFAQGVNISDSVDTFREKAFDDTMEANVKFIIAAMQRLIEANAIANACRVVVISSVWEQLGRKNRLSYMVSKAAVGGLVRSMANDLGRRNVLINAVLPGPVDSLMTRNMLPHEQISELSERMPLRGMVTPDEVARLVVFLASAENTSITGQSVFIDRGMSIAEDF